MKPETLLRLYFLNRNNLKGVRNKISSINEPDEEGYHDFVNLNLYRDYYWSKEQDYLSRFPGWVAVLEYKEGFTTREMELAILLDRQRLLKKELSIIKRRMFYAGRNLIKKQDEA